MGGDSWYPTPKKLLAVPNSETIRWIPKCFGKCKNVLEVLCHQDEFGGDGTSQAAGEDKSVQFLSVCPSRF